MEGLRDAANADDPVLPNEALDFLLSSDGFLPTNTETVCLPTSCHTAAATATTASAATATAYYFYDEPPAEEAAAAAAPLPATTTTTTTPAAAAAQLLRLRPAMELRVSVFSLCYSLGPFARRCRTTTGPSRPAPGELELAKNGSLVEGFWDYDQSGPPAERELLDVLVALVPATHEDSS